MSERTDNAGFDDLEIDALTDDDFEDVAGGERNPYPCSQRWCSDGQFDDI